MLHHHASHPISPNSSISHHLPNHINSPTTHNPQHHLNGGEKRYSPHGSPESQTSSVYLSPPNYAQTEDDYSAQVSPQNIGVVRQTSPRFDTENTKKTYINLSTPPMEAKGVQQGEEKGPYMYSPATTPTHLQEKYNGFVGGSNQVWRTQEAAIAARESQQRPSTIIACQAAQRSAMSHAGLNHGVGQQGEMGAFARLTDLLYDDLNRDEFDVYLKKET